MGELQLESWILKKKKTREKHIKKICLIFSIGCLFTRRWCHWSTSSVWGWHWWWRSWCLWFGRRSIGIFCGAQKRFFKHRRRLSSFPVFHDVQLPFPFIGFLMSFFSAFILIFFFFHGDFSVFFLLDIGSLGFNHLDPSINFDLRFLKWLQISFFPFELDPQFPNLFGPIFGPLNSSVWKFLLLFF